MRRKEKEKRETLVWQTCHSTQRTAPSWMGSYQYRPKIVRTTRYWMKEHFRDRNRVKDTEKETQNNSAWSCEMSRTTRSQPRASNTAVLACPSASRPDTQGTFSICVWRAKLSCHKAFPTHALHEKALWLSLGTRNTWLGFGKHRWNLISHGTWTPFSWKKVECVTHNSTPASTPLL